MLSATLRAQLDPEAVQRLAFMQIQGIFTLVTTEDHLNAESLCLLSRQYWQFFGAFGHGDWGNPQLKEIRARVREWPERAHIDTANGYFRASLRRSPVETGPWYWALEWNKYLRVLGAIALPGEQLLENLPALDWVKLSDEVRMRRDTPEPDGVDGLFFEQATS